MILSCAFVKIKSGRHTQQLFCKRSIWFISLHQQITRTSVQCGVPTNLQYESCCVCPPATSEWSNFDKCTRKNRQAERVFLQSFAALAIWWCSYKRQMLLTLYQKDLCNSQHLLLTPKIWESVEQNVLQRSIRPFFPPPQIKTKKSGLGTRLYTLVILIYALFVTKFLTAIFILFS